MGPWGSVLVTTCWPSCATTAPETGEANNRASSRIATNLGTTECYTSRWLGKPFLWFLWHFCWDIIYNTKKLNNFEQAHYITLHCATCNTLFHDIFTDVKTHVRTVCHKPHLKHGCLAELDSPRQHFW